MLHSRIKKSFFLSLLLGALLVQAPIAHAAAPATCADNDPNCYTLLAPLPLTNPSDAGNADKTANPTTYISGIIDLTIAAAGVIAVIMIVLGGFQYVTTESFGGKSNAKESINRAIIGLLLVIGAFTILKTINPQLVNLGINVQPISNSPEIEQSGICAGTVVNGVCTVSPSTNDASAVGCIDSCVPTKSFSFPQKDPPVGCSGTVCYVNQSLGSQLVSLNTFLKEDGVSWQVSEMFPQTVAHADDCHKPNTSQSGTCVDAVFFKANDPTIMSKILADTSKVFSSFVYEACPMSRTNQLKTQFPKYASHFNCFSTTDGDNMHINMAGSGSF